MCGLKERHHEKVHLMLIVICKGKCYRDIIIGTVVMDINFIIHLKYLYRFQFTPLVLLAWLERNKLRLSTYEQHMYVIV